MTRGIGPGFLAGMKPTRFLPALALAVAACADSIAPLPDEGRPEALEFSMGGYFGASTKVVLVGDTVVYTISYPWAPAMPAVIDTVRAVPSAESWQAFWNAMDRSGVNRWRGPYVAERIADGLGWELTLRTGGRTIHSSGTNAYPDHRGREHEGESTEEWKGAVDAILTLVGMRYGS